MENWLHEEAVDVHRFSTGLSHYVVATKTSAGSEYVIRIARPERSQEFADGLVWHGKLEPLGVPLPRIYQTGEIEGCGFAVYDRLPGEDLEDIYGLLGRETREHLAKAVARVQQKVSLLEKEELTKFPDWPDTVEMILDRSEREILKGGIAKRSYVDLARDAVGKRNDYLHSVRKVPFLYDLNVRNVIVHRGRLSGIVDVDEVWLGDPLLSLGRGKTLLLAAQQSPDYIEFWCDYLTLSEDERSIVDLYALVYCIRFMGTAGQRLNGNYSITTDADNLPIVEGVAKNLLRNLA